MPTDPVKAKKLVEMLASIKGRHTELVTVYVPAGYNINESIGQLNQESGTAINIKSKSVRNNVVDALGKIVQQLRQYKKTPENGVAVFCGNVSPHEGKVDLQLWVIEPPEPLKVKLYWCDQRFDTAPLQDMFEEKDIYGLMVFDSKEATFATLKGKKVDILQNLDSIVPSKMRAGGQSAQRFERVRDGMLNDFMKKIGDYFRSCFESDKIKGVIMGGPGPLKEIWLEGDFISDDLKKKIIGVRNVGYTNEVGIEELLNSVDDILKEASAVKEKNLMKRFFDELYRTGGKATYGLEKVFKSIEMGAADLVLVTEKPIYEEVEYVCSCGFSEKKLVKIVEKNEQKCPKCGNLLRVIGTMDFIEYLAEKAATTGASVVTVSTDTPEGEAFYNIGGIGAMLRFNFQ